MAKPAKPITTLKKRGEFLALRRAPRVSGSEFVMQGNLTDQSDAERPELTVGYTVTKKTGNAVVRNRIKRRLKAAVAIAAGSVNLGHDDGESRSGRRVSGKMVLVARREALTQNFSAMVAKITKGIDHLLAKGNKAD
jgi:ribonuclease P protein component